MLPAAARDRPLGAVAWADAALSLYHRCVLYTNGVKPAVHSCLKEVRRGACGIIPLLHLARNCSGPHFHPQTSEEDAFQTGLKKIYMYLFC